MKTGQVIILVGLVLVLAVAIAAVVVAAITLSKVNSNNNSRDKPTDAPAGTTTPGAGTTTGPGPDLEWWKSSPIYQVYPRSFQDSDGDGTGDLKGIQSRVPYLRDLGIKAIWLSPVYQSPMKDYGYDISNFTNIDPLFGTLQDFNDLKDELHKYGMYLIMDFVPNHSSDQHFWFQQSLLGVDPYKDYYVWKDKPTDKDLPTNWISIFGNTTWEWAESRKQFYLHQFLIQQPDLNYRNPKLRQEMVDILNVWVDRGVDGFRVDAIPFLVEDAQFRDEPKSDQDVPSNNYGYLNHIYTAGLPETYDVVQEWTTFFRTYGAHNNKHIFVCTEGYADVSHVMKYYAMGVDFPFNFNLISMDSTTNASTLRSMITSWMNYMPAGSWPNWVLGNHDKNRVATRLGGRKYIDIANMLLLLLPGTPTCYYGDEIGMIDANISYEDSRDPSGCKWGPDGYMNFTRDPERTPMQWDTSKNGGFTKGTNGTWLPMGPEWETYNVELESKDQNSHLNIFKSLVKLRQEPVFRGATNLRLIDIGNEDIFAFTRELDSKSSYLIVLNFGHDQKSASIPYGLGTGTGQVVVRSALAAHSIGDTIFFNQTLVMNDAEGYVIKLIETY